MIIPTRKLVFWSWVVFPALVCIGAIAPAVSYLFHALIIILCLVSIMDLIISRDHLKEIVISTPDKIRTSVDRLSDFVIHIQSPHKNGLRLRIGLRFPEEIDPENPVIDVSLPRGKDRCEMLFQIKTKRTGQYQARDIIMETHSKMGLWAIRKRVAMSTEINSYPNLFGERRALASFFLRPEHGSHLHIPVGKGQDLDQLRDYMPGDHFGDIHWKATAKRHRPITKTYQVQRAQQIYLIIDASRLSARSIDLLTINQKMDSDNYQQDDEDGHTTILERYITASLIMILAAHRLGDLSGILVFSDNIERFASARGGKAHYNTCRNMLFTLRPGLVSPDFAEVFSFIGTHIRRRSLLIFLTNLDDHALSEDFVKNVNIIARKHLISVNTPFVQGTRPLFTSAELVNADDIYTHLTGQLLWERVRSLQRGLRHEGIRLFQLENKGMCTQLVSQYLEVKQRQLI